MLKLFKTGLRYRRGLNNGALLAYDDVIKLIKDENLHGQQKIITRIRLKQMRIANYIRAQEKKHG